MTLRRLAAIAAVVLCPLAAAPASTGYPGCAPGPDLTLRAADGAKLVAHRFGRGKTAIVLAHEHGGNVCQWVPYARRLASLGYTAIAFDFRGYGRSTFHTPLNYAADVAAAVKAARKLGARTVILVGASIGANAVVVAGASIRPAVDGVISLSAPATFRLDAVTAVKRLRSPALYVAGTLDSGGIYRDDARKLYRLTAAEDKAIELVPSGEHGVQLVGHPGKARTLVEDLSASTSVESASVDVQADAEEQQRPEQHCEHRGDDLPDGVHVHEVVMGGGDNDADGQVDRRQQARAAPDTFTGAREIRHDPCAPGRAGETSWSAW